MRPCFRAAVAVFALLAGLPARSVACEPQEAAAAPTARRLTGGGEVVLIAGPTDDDAFFNYTDYEHNALRIARLRLMGEGRIAPRFSVLAEARTENGDGVQIPGFSAAGSRGRTAISQCRRASFRR